MPFRITTRILSSCTSMPADIFAHSLNNRPVSKMSTTPTAIVIFCFIFDDVALVSPSSRLTTSTVPWLSPESTTRFLIPIFFSRRRSSLTPLPERIPHTQYGGDDQRPDKQICASRCPFAYISDDNQDGTDQCDPVFIS